jgi:DNA gyrase subunit B
MPDDEIVVLKGLQGVRKRSALFLGDTTRPALANKLLEEALCIGLHALQTEDAGSLEVRFHEDQSVSVGDDSTGLDVSPDSLGMRFPEQLMTQLFACAHDKSFETVHFCGVGIICANAYSTWLQIEVFKDGVHWQQTYREGEAITSFAPVGETAQHGNRLHFLPDPTIFAFPEFDRLLFATWFSSLEIPATCVEINDDLTRMTMTRIA